MDDEITNPLVEETPAEVPAEAVEAEPAEEVAGSEDAVVADVVQPE